MKTLKYKNLSAAKFTAAVRALLPQNVNEDQYIIVINYRDRDDKEWYMGKRLSGNYAETTESAGYYLEAMRTRNADGLEITLEEPEK